MSGLTAGNFEERYSTLNSRAYSGALIDRQNVILELLKLSQDEFEKFNPAHQSRLVNLLQDACRTRNHEILLSGFCLAQSNQLHAWQKESLVSMLKEISDAAYARLTEAQQANLLQVFQLSHTGNPLHVPDKAVFVQLPEWMQKAWIDRIIVNNQHIDTYLMNLVFNNNLKEHIASHYYHALLEMDKPRVDALIPYVTDEKRGELTAKAAKELDRQAEEAEKLRQLQIQQEEAQRKEEQARKAAQHQKPAAAERPVFFSKSNLACNDCAFEMDVA